MVHSNNVAFTPGPRQVARSITGPFFKDGGNNYMFLNDQELNRLAAEAIAAPLEDRCPAGSSFSGTSSSRATACRWAASSTSASLRGRFPPEPQRPAGRSLGCQVD